MLYKLKSLYKNFLERSIDIILPPRCPISGELVLQNGTLDASVWQKLNFIEKPFCPHCGLPYQNHSQEGLLCGACLSEPPDFDLARAALYYDDGSRGLILAFKHADRTLLTPLLTQLLMRCVPPDSLTHADLIMPVPLHRWRLLKRRYNQAAELARVLSRKTDIPWNPHLLQRRRNTDSQGHKNKSQRRKNVRGAFTVSSQDKHHIKNKHIILLDDVYTTGATLNACCKTLRNAGAKHITVLTLARAAAKQ
jgi:ComF family protein